MGGIPPHLKVEPDSPIERGRAGTAGLNLWPAPALPENWFLCRTQCAGLSNSVQGLRVSVRREAFMGKAGGDRGSMRVTGTTLGRSFRDCSPAPGGASGAIVCLDGRGESGPHPRNPRTEGLTSRKVGGEPTFGAQQLKSRPPAADGADPVVHGLLVGLVHLVHVPGARGGKTNHFDRERGIATGPPGNANPEHAAGRNSKHTEARPGTRLRESSIVTSVVRAPIIYVARRGLNHEGDAHRSGPVEPVAAFGHVTGTRWDGLSPVSGNGPTRPQVPPALPQNWFQCRT
jgi:hypothetical protein